MWLIVVAQDSGSSTVTTPLTYSAVNAKPTTLVAGLGTHYKLVPDVTLLAGTRATESLGAYCDLAKNQLLGINGIYPQGLYQGVSTTSVIATNTAGL